MTSPIRGPLHPPPMVYRVLRCAGLVAALVVAAPSAALFGSDAADGATLHTRLEESRPSDATTVTASPDEIWLRFSTAVQRGLSTVRLTGPGGEVIPVAAVAYVDGTQEMQLRAGLLGALESGAYTVAWTTAGPDSHIIEGTFGFVVALPAQAEPAADTAAIEGDGGQDDTAAVVEPGAAGAAPLVPVQAGETSEFAEATAPLGLIARWFTFLGSILLLGIAAFHVVVLGGAKRRGEAEAVAEFLPRLRGYGFVVATFAMFAAVLRLADGFASFGVGRIGPLLFGSPWGLGWWIFLAGAATAFIGIRVSGKAGTRAAGWRLVAVGAILTALSMPFSGHGWAAPQRAIAAPAHFLHTIGAGVWLGGLAVLVLVALPFLSKRRDEEGRSPEAPAWVASFSKMALVGVAVLLLSGAVNSWQHVGGPQALFGTAYGRTLLVKIGVLGGALLIGLYNWKQARPALDETGRPGIIRLPATIELALGIGVLLVTAVLVAMHLPEM